MVTNTGRRKGGWDNKDTGLPIRQMSPSRHRHGPAKQRLRWRFPWELCLLICAIVIVAVTALGRAPSGPPQPADTQAHEASQHGRKASPAHAMEASRPLRVTIPAIRVHAPLSGLTLEGSGRLAAPPETDNNLAGWWADGPIPGAQGTAIIAGHVDIPTGPAVFYNLGALTSGMAINVLRADGSTAHFTVDSVDVYDADHFPDHKVYANTGQPELRLITCGGGFDKQRQQYNGNVVVSAHLTTP